MAVKKHKPDTTEPFIIHDLTLVSPDRSSKDIGKLKESIVSAESIYFPNRVALYDLYHDVLSMDGFLRGIIQKRIDAVLNKKIKFLKKDGKQDDDLTDLIKSEKGRDMITLLMESKLWGTSGMEFVIGDELNFKEVPRKHIKPEKGVITKSQYAVSEENGFAYEDMPFVWVVGKKNDLGLLLACSMYAIYKRGGFGDFAQYVEIFGQPVRIMKYDAYDTKTKQELKSLLTDSGSSLAMMIPKQAEFEMLDGKTSNGDGKLQIGLKDACNEEMAIAILGNTETTSSSKSSGYAQSKEHGEQQDELTVSDLIFVENLLNSKKFKQILKSYGFNIDGKFEFELDLNLTKLKLRIEIDMVVCTKVPIGDDYWYETYRIPKPDNYDELKAKMEADKVQPEAEPTPTNSKKAPMPQPKKGQLTETKKQNLMDLLFKGLADFFDPAQH
jgi:phage gp29-like protein